MTATNVVKSALRASAARVVKAKLPKGLPPATVNRLVKEEYERRLAAHEARQQTDNPQA